MNGNSRLIAAPRSKPHNVGGEYSIIGEFEDEGGGEGESSSLPEYCSESDGIVMVDSVSGIRSEAISGSRILNTRKRYMCQSSFPMKQADMFHLSLSKLPAKCPKALVPALGSNDA